MSFFDFIMGDPMGGMMGDMGAGGLPTEMPFQGMGALRTPDQLGAGLPPIQNMPSPMPDMTSMSSPMGGEMMPPQSPQMGYGQPTNLGVRPGMDRLTVQNMPFFRNPASSPSGMAVEGANRSANIMQRFFPNSFNRMTGGSSPLSSGNENTTSPPSSNPTTDLSSLSSKTELPTQGEATSMSKMNFSGKKSEIADRIRQITSGESKYIKPEWMVRVANTESRLNPNAVSPTGAKGLFQFIPSTWKGMQRSYGDLKNPFSIEDNTRAGVRFMEQNRGILQKSLGREPQLHELYMAHNLGAGGAIRLLKANPDTRVYKSVIGSNPLHNPKFLMGKGAPLTAAEAIKRYAKEFSGV